jgi:WD40 repeat protein
LPGKFQQAVFAGPDRQLIASQPAKAGTVGNQLQLIHGKTGALLKTIPTRFDIQVLAVSADQTLLAAAGADSSIHFLDPKTLEEKPALRAHEGEISALAFHPSLPILGSASSDGSIKLWNYQTRRMLDHFIGLNGVPVALAFSPNGALLFAEAQETTMRLYDVSHLNSPAGSTGSK